MCFIWQEGRLLPAYDYAIREGDRLIFMEDDSNILDDMLESIAGG